MTDEDGGSPAGPTVDSADGREASDPVAADPAADPEGADDPVAARERGDRRPAYAPPDDDGFDWRGWSLVGLVFVCFLLIPGAILLLPGARGFLGSLGLSLRDAYLTLPLLPALVLGAVAVWSAVASRRA